MTVNLKSCSCRDGQRIQFKTCDCCGGQLMYDANIVEQLSVMFEHIERQEAILHQWLEVSQDIGGANITVLRDKSHKAVALSHKMRMGE